VRYLSVALFVCLSWSCTAATWDAIGAAAAGAAAGMSASSYAGAAGKLMLFGGPGHSTYLGCLNCSEFASDSLFNEVGRHGSPYQSESIFNKFGQFGSAYSSYSACNPYASDPPVIVDANGRFYGRLTVNDYNTQRTRNSAWQTLVALACSD
jgi:hypothetical protein